MKKKVLMVVVSGENKDILQQALIKEEAESAPFES
jgi:hypothetical protein